MSNGCGCMGTSLAWQLTGVGIGVAGVAMAAHNAGMAAMARAREERAQASYDAWVAAELANAGRLAEALAAERAENAKLRRALAQRQAYIESLRG